MEKISDTQSQRKIQEELRGKSPDEIITWALKNYGNRVALASSYGAEDVVLTDMLVKVTADLKKRGELPENFSPKIFTLDTGRLPQETYDVMDEISKKYGITPEVYFPEAASVENMVMEHGFNLFYKSPDLRKLCCQVRKVEPLKRAFQNLDAWICGLRREQSVTRAALEKVEFEERDGRQIVKLNPLADWKESDVWDYIKKNSVPYNSLHDKGYPSIGCAPCTRAVKKTEDFRAGRWWWETPQQKECGLHVKNK